MLENQEVTQQRVQPWSRTKDLHILAAQCLWLTLLAAMAWKVRQQVGSVCKEPYVIFCGCMMQDMMYTCVYTCI